MREKNTKPQRVWITGASSGIGEACAYQYAARKATLILTSSSLQKLEPVAEKCRAMGAEVTLLPYDLRQLDGIGALVQDAWEKHGGIDILFCNAGVSQRTNIEETSMEVFHTLMDLNFFAPVEMAKAILPLMLANGGGHIAVTTSIAGRFGFPLRCGYSASKHALYGFFETLQAEYTDKGIRTTIIYLVERSDTSPPIAVIADSINTRASSEMPYTLGITGGFCPFGVDPSSYGTEYGSVIENSA